MKKKFLSIYFPNWHISLIRHLNGLSGQANIILTSRIRNEASVMRCCPASAESGVREGMSVAQARIFVPDPVCTEFDAERSFKMFLKTAEKFISFAPQIGIDPKLWEAWQRGTLESLPDIYFGICANLCGTDRLYRNLPETVKRILAKITAAGFPVKAALAETPGAAFAFSRFGKEQFFIYNGSSAQNVMDNLPLAALRMESGTLESLEEVGIKTIRQLRGLPGRCLSPRFGREALRKLNQALGREEDLIHPIYSSRSYSFSRRIEFEIVSKQILAKLIFGLFEKLILKLKRDGLCSSLYRFEVTYRQQTDGQRATLAKEFSLFRASSDLRYILSLMEVQIETLNFPGNIEKIGVKAVIPEKEQPLQERIFDTGQQPDLCLVAALDKVASRLGRESIRTLEFFPSFIPENSFAFRKAGDINSFNTTCSLSHEKPSWLINPPEPIESIALLPDKPPAVITWNGKTRRIVEGRLLENVRHEWWKDKKGSREYFKVKDETGLWLWIFRHSESQKWFIQGVWA